MSEMDVKSKVTLDTSDYERGAGRVQKSTGGMTGGIDKNRIAMRGAVIAGNLYAKAIGYVASTAIKMAKDQLRMEKSLSKVNTLLGVGRAELNRYGQELEKIAVDTNVSAIELSDGLYEALSAGVEVGESMQFMETSAKLARAGFTDVTTSVDGLTTVINAWGKSSSDANEIADIFVKTQAQGKLTVDEMGRSISNVAPLAAAMGIQFKEVAASLSTMTAQGIPAAQAVTQMRSALSELSKETSTANKELVIATGKSFPELQAEGKSLAEVMQILTERAEATGRSANNMFSSVEAGGYILATAGANAEDYAENLKGIESAAGSMDEAHSQATDNISDNWTKFVGLMKQRVTPAVDEVISKTNTLIKRMNETATAENNLAEARRINSDVLEAYERRLKATEKSHGTYSEATKRSRQELWDFVEATIEAEKVEKAFFEARKKGLLEAPESVLTTESDDDGSDVIQVQKSHNEKQLENHKSHLLRMANLESESNAERKLIDEEFKRDQLERDLEYYSSQNDTTAEDRLKREIDLINQEAEVKKAMEEVEREEALERRRLFNEQISELEYEARELEGIELSEHNIKIAKMEADMYDEKIDSRKDYLNNLSNIHKEEKRLADLRAKEDEEHRNVLMKNARESNKIILSLQKSLLQGQIKGVDDFIEVTGQMVAADAASKSVEMTIGGIFNRALAASYTAKMMPSMALSAQRASAENFAAAATFGTIAGGATIISSAAGGSSGGGSEEGNNGSTGSSITDTDNAVDDILEGSEGSQSGQTIVLQGMEWFTDALGKYYKNRFNVDVTLRPKGGYQ